MTAPTTHHLTITLRDGNVARGEVVHMQPVEERRRQDVAEVYITISTRLVPYYYEAVHSTATQSITGYLVIHSCQAMNGSYLYKGTLYMAAPTP